MKTVGHLGDIADTEPGPVFQGHQSDILELLLIVGSAFGSQRHFSGLGFQGSGGISME